MEKSDEDLIREYRAGNKEALAAVIERHISGVYSFILSRARNREEAEDVAQDTFLKAWKHIRTFAEGKSFKTWLYTIARNTLIDRVRRKKSLSFDEFASEADEPYEQSIRADDPLPDELFAAQSRKDELARALAKLKPEYAEVLTLHYSKELTLKEVSQVLGIPLNTVKSRDRRALLALKSLLAPEGGPKA